MRIIGLATMLVGAATYIYPVYRSSVPFHIAITDDNAHYLAFGLIALGLVLVIIRGRG